MSNSNGTTNGNGSNGQTIDASSRAFLLQQLYVKDMSFEVPNGPQVFQEMGTEPETELNIRNSHSSVGDNLYEVVLHIRVHTKKGNDTVFLAELDQAGVYAIQGYAAEDTAQLLGTQCPASLRAFAIP